MREFIKQVLRGICDAKILRAKKMTRLISTLLLILFLSISGAVTGAVPAPAAQFSNPQSAHQYCPNDTIVWLNLPTGIYHFNGQRWYANTKDGVYVCEKEADQVGDRPSRNGQ